MHYMFHCQSLHILLSSALVVAEEETPLEEANQREGAMPVFVISAALRKILSALSPVERPE